MPPNSELALDFAAPDTLAIFSFAAREAVTASVAFCPAASPAWRPVGLNPPFKAVPMPPIALLASEPAAIPATPPSLPATALNAASFNPLEIAPGIILLKSGSFAKGFLSF